MSVFLKPRFWSLVVALALVGAFPTQSSAAHPFLTPQPPFITLDPGVPPGSGVTAIISSGETYHSFLFEGIPDGIGIAPGPTPGTANVFVTHEQSRVPFRAQADFVDSSVSKLTLDTSTGAVVSAEVAISSDEGYIRFCSAFMAGPDEGFQNYTFFANEESNDVIDVPAGAPYGPDPAVAPQRQAGYVVALDAATGTFSQIAGMGRHNHENTVVVPGGWNQFAALSTDDTFTATTSQLYMYLFNHESHLWQDKGSLWAFRVTRTQDGPVDPTDPFNEANDYIDLSPGEEFQGQFIRVPKDIARGVTADPPQDALENWSVENNVFTFVRLEDLAYDRHNPRVVYIADTGASRVVPDPATGRLHRPRGAAGQANGGRIFKMVFNEKNPKKVDSFTVFAQGDNGGLGAFVPFQSPDNMDTSAMSLMVQEDADNAKIWWYDFGSDSWSVAATVNDPDGESSGIVDASAWFGDGWWLLDVQGHGQFVEQEQVGDVLFKRESGQLLLMKIPGST